MTPKFKVGDLIVFDGGGYNNDPILVLAYSAVSVDTSIIPHGSRSYTVLDCDIRDEWWAEWVESNYKLLFRNS